MHEHLEFLEKLRKEKTDINAIKDYIMVAMKSIPVTTAIVNNSANLFRAVKRRDKDLNKKNNLSYCQTEYLEKLTIGRANYPKQPIFYAAIDELVAMKEVSELWNNLSKKSGEETFYVGRWFVEKPFFVVETVHSSLFEKVNLELKKKKIYHNEIIREMEPESSAEMIDLLSYMSDRFSEIDEDSTTYALTSVFSNFSYEGNKYSRKGIDTKGIIYPSVVNPTKINIAIVPKLIDEEYLTLREVVEYKVFLDNNKWNYKLTRKTKTSGVIKDEFCLDDI